MIKVCDCIMGSGKSSACINYMNEHPDQKYIYISPYTDEAKRIVMACPSLDFQEPQDKWSNGYSKSRHTAELLKLGKNIASTHQCFKFYTPDMHEAIRAGEYTLMVDENVAALEEYKNITQADIDMMSSCGYIELTDDGYAITGKEYSGIWGNEFLRFLWSRTLIKFTSDESDGRDTYYYWALPERLLSAFKDIVIMTYMFKGTDMYYYLKMCGLPYTEIGVRHRDDGYHFDESIIGSSDSSAYLKDKIYICQNASRNEIGDDYHALSMNWFKNPKHKEDVEVMRRQLYNWFNNDNRGTGKKKRLWATIGETYGQLRSAGVWDNNLVFNYRATNDYADRTILAYPVNVFVNVGKKNYFTARGCDFVEDQYALSTMVQWIWRSAIRNGKDIRVYIPSSRMRDLFEGWLNSLATPSNAEIMVPEGGAA